MQEYQTSEDLLAPVGHQSAIDFLEASDVPAHMSTELTTVINLIGTR